MRKGELDKLSKILLRRNEPDIVVDIQQGKERSQSALCCAQTEIAC